MTAQASAAGSSSALVKPVWLAERWPTIAFALIALSGCAFAFVGLSASSYWIDELFTLFVIDHHGGWPELYRRILTDTWPPAYYVILYGWSQLFGTSETALRSLSAIFAVGAIAVFFQGTRAALSLNARTFAAAVAVTSLYWFEQAQNARAYGLCLLISTGMLSLALSIHRAARRGQAAPAWRLLALSALALLGAFTHFYLLLEAGAVFGFLILTSSSMAVRVALTGSGLAILAADGAFMSVLLKHTAQDIHHMWFRADAHFFRSQWDEAIKNVAADYVRVGLLLLAIMAVIRRRPPAHRPATEDGGDLAWLAMLAGFVFVGVAAAGIAVSLTMAPSFASRNLLVAAPFAWALVGALYEFGEPDPRRIVGAVLAGLLVICVGAYAPRAMGRTLPRNEDWRTSGRFVDSLAACRGQVIPVLQPRNFGPHTPFFTRLSERWFYGRYSGDRLQAFLPDAFRGQSAAPDLSSLLVQRTAGSGGCPVLAWGVHDLQEPEAAALADTLARRTGGYVQLLSFRDERPSRLGFKPKASAFVWLAVKSPSQRLQASPLLGVETFPAAQPIPWPKPSEP